RKSRGSPTAAARGGRSNSPPAPRFSSRNGTGNTAERACAIRTAAARERAAAHACGRLGNRGAGGLFGRPPLAAAVGDPLDFRGSRLHERNAESYSVARGFPLLRR